MKQFLDKFNDADFDLLIILCLTFVSWAAFMTFLWTVKHLALKTKEEYCKWCDGPCRGNVDEEIIEF